ncbi:uncharacterized protein K460DRAFT_434451 [Cucurbitaria berberidis CBS 394.84]|uniref:Uncharacterized protein n=1 Tax=Cucurbitaria berberidis CBS 394.84 TaxID=1168544 RepID=A0A9P4G9G3_9PLEO|nr:uncharacterized protein K460DRAFT_434451 [Cucurbitaria berberidis CBS 394.84]KAF1841332.1 hypothetical protein K460DRAFT_434451 [Cucurbitaria berberidis CBS 394.84]
MIPDLTIRLVDLEVREGGRLLAVATGLEMTPGGGHLLVAATGLEMRPGRGHPFATVVVIEMSPGGGYLLMAATRLEMSPGLATLLVNLKISPGERLLTVATGLEMSPGLAIRLVNLEVNPGGGHRLAAITRLEMSLRPDTHLVDLGTSPGGRLLAVATELEMIPGGRLLAATTELVRLYDTHILTVSSQSIGQYGDPNHHEPPTRTEALKPLCLRELTEESVASEEHGHRYDAMTDGRVEGTGIWGIGIDWVVVLNFDVFQHVLLPAEKETTYGATQSPSRQVDCGYSGIATTVDRG